MNGRLGTRAEVVLHGGALDSILSAADAAVLEDIRVGVYLAGEVGQDVNGNFFEIKGVIGGPDGAVGIAVTSSEEGTYATPEDVSSITSSFGCGVLIVIDPYACEFAVYIVDDGDCRRADAVVTG